MLSFLSFETFSTETPPNNNLPPKIANKAHRPHQPRFGGSWQLIGPPQSIQMLPSQCPHTCQKTSPPDVGEGLWERCAAERHNINPG